MITVDELKSLIRDVPDFPKQGVVFKDITPLLRSSAALMRTMQLLAEPFLESGITQVVAI